MKAKIFSTVILSGSLFILLASPVRAQISAWGDTCVGGYGTGPKDVATIQGIECLIGNVLAVAITLIGIAAFVMFIIGSFRYLTAGANSKGVESGKNSFTFAILGIIVALASYVILSFLSQFTGIPTLLQFNTQIENIQ